MGGYLLNFSIYTLAMLGVICIALFVFKFAMSGSPLSKKSKFLNVEDTLKLSARKSIYVLRAGNEKFLVAADVDSTSLISKLNSGDDLNIQEFDQSMTENSNTSAFGDEVIDMKKRRASSKSPMMRGIANKLDF